MYFNANTTICIVLLLYSSIYSTPLIITFSSTSTGSSFGVVEGVNMESCMGVACKARLVGRWPMMVGGVPSFLTGKFLTVFMGRDLIAM